MSTTATAASPVQKSIQNIDDATVRFCGDSGDGMQLAGTQFTNTSALAGNDIATFPDFPAEIRAPRGTKAGVSGFQIHFSSKDIFTPGDTVDCAGGDESGGAGDERLGSPHRRHPDRQRATSSTPRVSSRPATRPIRSKTAASSRIACCRST